MARGHDNKRDLWNRTQAVFLAALDIPRAGRGAFLEEACQGDAELRAEVDSLLEHDQGEAPLDAAFQVAAASIVDDDAMVGQRAGNYQIIAPLGRGGMGAVYRAVRADDVFSKQVAIKVVKRGMDTDAMLERFRQERQILANLDHPYIARLLDGGSIEGQPFFAMELVEGMPIQLYCRQGNLSPEEVCRLFLKVCEGVEYAHHNLIVHRDLKPSNILIKEDGTPKLLDFGVAKVLRSEGADVTRIAQRPLTPEYASPEHYRGHPATTATDVYALAAVLYELLTGVQAHKVSSDHPEEWERIICNEEVERPRLANPRLPRDLETIVMMGLRKEPERRYPSVEQFAADIRRYLDGRPVEASPDTLAYRSSKFIRRNRIWVAAASLALVSLVGATAASLLAARKASHEEQRATLRLAQLVELSNRSLFDVHSDIERLAGATAARRKLVATTLDFLEKLSQEPGSDEQLKLALGSAYWRTGDIQGAPDTPSLGDPDGAQKSYARADQLLRPLIQKPSPAGQAVRVWVDLQLSRAALLSSTGRAESAVRLLRDTLPLAQGLSRVDPLESRQASLKKGLLGALQYAQPDDALAYGLQAIEDFSALVRRSPSELKLQTGLAEVHGLVAMLYRRRDQYKTALIHLSEAERLQRGVLAADPADAAHEHALMMIYGRTAAVLEDPDFDGRDVQRARGYYLKAEAIARRLSEADPLSRVAQYDLASVELRLGSGPTRSPDERESQELLGRAAAAFEKLAQAEPETVRYRVSLATVYRSLAENWQEQGQAAKALADYYKALNASEAALEKALHDGGTLSQVISDEIAIAGLLAAQGDRAGALRQARSAIARTENKEADGILAVSNLRASGYLAVARIEQRFGNWPEVRKASLEAAQSWSNALKLSKNQEWVASLAQAEALAAEASGHVETGRSARGLRR